MDFGRKSRASFVRMLSYAIMGLVVSVSPCFAQENQRALEEIQKRVEEEKARARALQEMEASGVMQGLPSPKSDLSFDPGCSDFY